ncbi:hypothetical protein K470DRAFT_259433, partial [Piedraia hortae CBS 480.64]
MSTTNTQKISNSGIHTLNNGQSIIPSSIRPDGSVRKEIRVRAGYVPPEDIEIYRHKHAQATSRAKKTVPGAEKVEVAQGKTVPGAEKVKAAQKKKAPSRKANGTETPSAAATAKEKTYGAEDDRPKVAPEGELNGTAIQRTNSKEEEREEVIDEQEREKKEARRISKKLRQARELLNKRDMGQSLLPEQTAKVDKIDELVGQLKGLGI